MITLNIISRTALLVLLPLGLAGCGEPESAPIEPQKRPDPLMVTVSDEQFANLKIANVTQAEIRESLRVPGRIELDETRMARVGSPVAGRITDLDAVVGQVVRRGQVLATINSTDLSNAQLGFLKAYSQRLLAERAAIRAQQLLDADVIGTAELQRRQSELAQANAEVSAARGQLKVLGMSEDAIAKLGESRSVNSLTYIVSSIAGTVIERKVTDGQVVQPADGIFLIADLAKVWLIADIPEQGAGLLRVGDAVQAEVPALPSHQFMGKLSFVAPTVSADTRTVRARMELANASGELKPAMLATVLIKGQRQKLPVVPNAAIVRDENREYVFVQTGKNQFQARLVTLGAEYEGMRELRSGAHEGEPIVVEGAFHLNNERKRRLLEGT